MASLRTHPPRRTGTANIIIIFSGATGTLSLFTATTFREHCPFAGTRTTFTQIIRITPLHISPFSIGIGAKIHRLRGVFARRTDVDFVGGSGGTGLIIKNSRIIQKTVPLLIAPVRHKMVFAGSGAIGIV